MITVKLEVCSWVSASLGGSESGYHVIRKIIKRGSTLTDLFETLANAFPEFNQQVYNPDGGHMSEQIMVSLNHKLVQESEFPQTILKDNDEIDLSLILVGG